MKLLTILLCVSLLVGTVSASYTDTGIDYHDTITSAHGGIRLPTMGEVDCFTPNTPTPSGGAIHTYQKGILTIPINPANLIKAWVYEDIEIE